jgi:glycosyltransferase involved in cell wall biosynthesis
MRVVVVSDFELGSHRAHAINVVKTAGGFARLDHDVTVLCRAPARPIPEKQAAKEYGEPGLRWVTAPALGARPVEGPAREERFARWALPVLENADFVYARHFAAGLAAAELGVPTMIETHAYVGDTNPLLQKAIEATQNALAALVTISPTLREHYISRGADPQRVHVVPDGVDLDLFTPPTGPRGPGVCPFDRSHRAHALYAGHLYDHKGIPTMIAAARLMPEVGVDLLGGASEDIARVKRLASIPDMYNLRVHGHRPHAEVPAWLWHADVLLLPPSAHEPSAAWTSPVKLGEYLAAGPPIVASRIPGLQAWVDEPAVRWFTPDEPRDLARAVTESLQEGPAHRTQRRGAARALAESFSYPERARAMVRAVHDGAAALVRRSNRRASA